MYYNSDIIGSPLGIVADEAKRVGRAAVAKDDEALPRALVKSGKKLTPFMNLWFTSAAYDKLMYDGLGVDRSKYEEKIDKERGNESFILD